MIFYHESKFHENDHFHQNYEISSNDESSSQRLVFHYNHEFSSQPLICTLIINVQNDDEFLL